MDVECGNIPEILSFVCEDLNLGERKSYMLSSEPK